MKKVWILERFVTTEELKDYVVMAESYVEKCEKDHPDRVNDAKNLLESSKQTLENNPNGQWIGMEGKSIYRIFCRVAKDCIRNAPKYLYRVVTAEIPDDAKYWIGYKNPIVNEGVLKYLKATV